jgi:hypothetical protein
MVTLVIAGAGLAAQALRLKRSWPSTLTFALTFALALLPLLLILRRSEAKVVEVTAQPPLPFESAITTVPVLHWLSENTTANDLIIGDDVVDVTGVLARPAAVSFSPYPYTGTFRYEYLQAVLERQCPRYERLYLVLHDISKPREVEEMYGAFIYDLATADLVKYPEVSRQITLAKGAVYELYCPDR